MMARFDLISKRFEVTFDEWGNSKSDDESPMVLGCRLGETSIRCTV